MKAIMNDMGIQEYEPKVIHQMLEYTYRYVTDLITDAKMLSAHARKKNIDVDDVRLSACQIQERHVSCPPARHVISQLARTKNSVALPVPGNKHGTRLPADRFCLTGVNYRLKSKKPKVVNNIRRPSSISNPPASSSTAEVGEDLDLEMNGSSWSLEDPPVFTIHYQSEDQTFSLPQAM